MYRYAHDYVRKWVTATSIERQYLSLGEVAELLGVHEQTVRRWVKAGELPAFKPGKEWRIRDRDLEEFLEARSFPKVQAPLQPTPEVAEEERRLIGYVRSWITYLSREAERYQEAVDAGRVDLGMYREATNSGGNLLRAVAVLMGDLEAAGLPDPKGNADGRKFFEALRRWTWAIDSLEKAVEAQISNSELAQHRTRREAALEEITKSAGEA